MKILGESTYIVGSVYPEDKSLQTLVNSYGTEMSNISL